MRLFTIIRTCMMAVPALVGLLFAACSGGDQFEFTGSKELLDTPEAVSFGGNETTTSFEVTASGTWTITGMPDWFNLNPEQGTGTSTVTITTNDASNPSAINDRTATLTIQSGNISRSLKVTQSKALEELQASTDSIAFKSDADLTQQLQITNNSQWTVENTAGDWLRIEPMSGTGNATLTLTAIQNTHEKPNETTVIVKSTQANGKSLSVKVSQEGIQTYINDVTTAIEAQAVGGTYDLKIGQGDATWVASIRTVDADKWLSLSSREGTGPQTIQVTCQETNLATPRVAEIVIRKKYGTDDREWLCTITQQAGSVPEISTNVEPHRTSAILMATIRSELSIQGYGIRYWLADAPGNKVEIGADQIHYDGGELKVELTNLPSGTQYYMQAWATNTVGKGECEAIPFQTLGGQPQAGENPTPNP